jgi:hypothetical protein
MRRAARKSYRKNPKFRVGDLAYDKFRQWTVKVRGIERRGDPEDGSEYEVFRVERVGNPPQGVYSPSIKFGDEYLTEGNWLQVVPKGTRG